jgi:nucleotide-binding universal stress UspA family protein
MRLPIVVPLDGSPVASGALPHAMAIARRLRAPLHLVRVVQPLPAAYQSTGVRPLDRSLDRERIDAAEQELAQTAEPLRHEGLDVETFTRSGEVIPSLAEHADIAKAQLVVMTTHGRSGWRRAVLGSVADALIRTVNTALYAVAAPDGVPMPVPTPPVPVLLPLDGSEQDDSAIALADLAREALGAELTLLHVIAPAVDKSRQPVQQVDRVDLRDLRASMAEYLDRVAALLGAPDVPVGCDVVMDDDPAEGILRYASRREFSQLALVTRGQRGMNKWLIGSVTDRLLREGRASLLLVRAAG